MSSALLSVLLVCNRKIERRIEHVMFILIGPHVRHFSDENQTVCPTLKK
jgi:cellobiose-specific phosphotransferase system component IIB